MGKPFAREIEEVFNIYNWAKNLNISNIQSFFIQNSCPLYIVGSGGSLSACYYAVSLLQSLGRFAKAITPLELYYIRSSLRKSIVLFISANGNNKDILFSCRTAFLAEPVSIACICMRINTQLGSKIKKYSRGKVFEFEIPTGRDGFLATNSLVALFTLLYRSITIKRQINIDFRQNQIVPRIESFFKKNHLDNTIIILFGGWGQSVAVDIESKCTESALCNTMISDYRNFGHGRHHWFAKRGEKSAVLALITPQEKILAKKTLAILPNTVPKLIIDTSYSSPVASLDLLIKSLYFINELGNRNGIDPGRPGVPEFGRKLYNLNYISNFSEKKDPKIPARELIAIKRKANVSSIQDMGKQEFDMWRKAYQKFINKLNRTPFGTIIFDYDGTLCSLDERFKGPSDEIANRINFLLDQGYQVGIVTGRGKSVRDDMQKCIDQKHWKNIIIGYYNGSQIDTLDNNNLPRSSLTINKKLMKLSDLFSLSQDVFTFDYELRPEQLTIQIKDILGWDRIRSYILHLIMTSGIKNIRVLESSHSIDIVSDNVSKLSIIEYCKEKAEYKLLPESCLCIGDRGQWPGNDFELLNTSYSLSVDEVSQNPKNCWNLTSHGFRNIEATLEYLDWFVYESGGLFIKVNK